MLHTELRNCTVFPTSLGMLIKLHGISFSHAHRLALGQCGAGFWSRFKVVSAGALSRVLPVEYWSIHFSRVWHTACVLLAKADSKFPREPVPFTSTAATAPVLALQSPCAACCSHAHEVVGHAVAATGLDVTVLFGGSSAADRAAGPEHLPSDYDFSLHSIGGVEDAQKIRATLESMGRHCVGAVQLLEIESHVPAPASEGARPNALLTFSCTCSVGHRMPVQIFCPGSGGTFSLAGALFHGVLAHSVPQFTALYRGLRHLLTTLPSRRRLPGVVASLLVARFLEFGGVAVAGQVYPLPLFRREGDFPSTLLSFTFPRQGPILLPADAKVFERDMGALLHYITSMEQRNTSLDLALHFFVPSGPACYVWKDFFATGGAAPGARDLLKGFMEPI